MKRFLVIIKRVLIVWGGLSLLAVLVFAGYSAFMFGIGSRARIDKASPHDVRFVLNWCGLGEQRIQDVLHSHVAARSFTGDHFDAYAIRITHVSLDELTAVGHDKTDHWYRGDQLPQVVDEAVSLVGSMSGSSGISWFPRETELKSSEVYIFPWSIYLHGTTPSAVEIIFIKPKEKMVYYFDAKL